jgi:hypothetical protein
MPTKQKRAQGRKNRAAGARLELKVRAELEKMGWTITKWMNTIDYEKNKIIPAKRKFNPFLKILGMGTGFPDFVCFKRNLDGNYEVIAVEVKANGYLDSIEKGMCQWMLENKIFSKILIAKKAEKRGQIEYIDFKEKYD